MSRGKKKQPVSESSRERILSAAAELATERGVAGATIARVCHRSGLPVSSVYWHFEDKDELFAEVIRTSFTEWLITVPKWQSSREGTLAEGLRGILGPASRSLEQVPDFMRVGMQVILDTGDPYAKTREAFLDVREQVHRMVTQWLALRLGTGVHSTVVDDIAVLVVALSDGLLVGSQIYEDWDPDEYVDLFATMIEAALPNAA